MLSIKYKELLFQSRSSVLKKKKISFGISGFPRSSLRRLFLGIYKNLVQQGCICGTLPLLYSALVFIVFYFGVYIAILTDVFGLNPILNIPNVLEFLLLVSLIFLYWWPVAFNRSRFFTSVLWYEQLSSSCPDFAVSIFQTLIFLSKRVSFCLWVWVQIVAAHFRILSIYLMFQYIPSFNPTLFTSFALNFWMHRPLLMFCFPTFITVDEDPLYFAPF